VLITGQQWKEDAWMAPSSRIDSRYSYYRQMQLVSCCRHAWFIFRMQLPVQQLLLTLVQGAPKATPQVPARDDPGGQQMLPVVGQVTGTQVPVAPEHVVHVGQFR
jgi:hypothetical protein